MALASVSALATTPLADQPIFSSINVPGNLALALSVEWPTANSSAYNEGTPTYDNNRNYLGYFDPLKCYVYRYAVNGGTDESYFEPVGPFTNRHCQGNWSGSFLNWASMPTIDPFRWALTGGYRVVDTPSQTILQKAWSSNQGGANIFKNRRLPNADSVARTTPLAPWSSLELAASWRGIQLAFRTTPNFGIPGTVSTTPYAASTVTAGTAYHVLIRVQVCVGTAAGGLLESNCTQYPAGNYKPTGLLHKYADRITYSAFGYLNETGNQRDGGVLRAPQKFVGPQTTWPGSPPAANLAKEWDPDTGVFVLNPDSALATTTSTALGIAIQNSGVMNYLNKFGQLNPGNYKGNDPVGELYYATLRYFKGQGNVPEWSNMGSASATTKAAWADGFPVITDWQDPIKYSCQRNFVLGIGDVNTHADKNVPGPTASADEPSKPAAVSGDTSVNAVLATNKVGQLHGMGASLGTLNPINPSGGACCSNNSALMAGLAYDANAKDIRPDDPAKSITKGFQSVQTYWLDVQENGVFKPNNQYYLATKYGGFKVPAAFDPYARTTDIRLDWWYTTTETVTGYGVTQPKPDNYFTAGNADNMVDGLTRTFSSIANALSRFTTSFSTAVPQVNVAGTDSFSAKYEPSNWTGELSGNSTVFDLDTGEPTNTNAWNFSTKLDVQAAGTGWSTKRRILTWNNDPAINGPVPFRSGSISAAQLAALNTVYRSGDDAADYLNYLRGEKLHEEASADPASSKMYRSRDKLLGDIVGSRPRVVKGPTSPFSESANPGFAAYVAANASRMPMVYVGSNSGMLHAVNASLTDPKGGTEVFAYVPGGLYQGPTGSATTTGLAARGDPDFTHSYFVDATPGIYDVNFARTVGGSGTDDWRTLLVGGLGKGGKSYYAIDITSPGTINTTVDANAVESTIATRVRWEFSDPDLGYTFGEPAAVKTKKHGWVLVFGSGYNNPDGRGYFFIVNPRDGSLIKKIEARTATGPAVGSPGNQAGLAHVQAFVLDRTDATADSVYAGDLLGNLWRLDVTDAAGNYPAPELLAQLTDGSGQPLPVTSRPMVIVQPISNTRWVTVGTGRLLATGDISNPQAQAMFAIKDGNGLAFAATAPTGFSYPIQLAKLKELTDLTQKVVLDTAKEIGWYVNLGSQAGMGWRVLSDPTSFFGVVEFAAMLPNGDACSPSGNSRVYAIDLGSGQSTLVQPNGITPMAYNDTIKGVVQEHKSLSVSGKHRFIACNNEGECKIIGNRQPDAMNLRRLNWRELPLAN